MHLEDYSIISALSYELSPNITVQKVQHKQTHNFYTLYTFDCTRADKTLTWKKIEERGKNSHHNLVNFLEIYEGTDFICAITDFCSNGSLLDIVKNCVKEAKRIGEELICRVLYQIVCAIKTADPALLSGKLSLDKIFIDEDFNVKLLNFDPQGGKKTTSKVKISHFGLILYSLCSLKVCYDKAEASNEVKDLHSLYSPELLGLMQGAIKDQSLLSKNFDKILCNSTILLKSSQWKKDHSFFAIKNKDKTIDTLSLQQREAQLKAKEDELNDRERELVMRERKVMLQEQLVADKLAQADLILKKAREDALDASPPCGDSVVNVVTSKKMSATIAKPVAFSRSKSERRVKFKGHSPLKEVNFNSSRRKSTNKRISVIPEECNNKENVCNSRASNKSSSSDGRGSSKKLFEDTGSELPPSKISWSDENKKYAFELLRIMNSTNNEKKTVTSGEMKHTYL